MRVDSRKILSFIESRGCATFAEIRAEFGMQPEAAKQAMWRLSSQGLAVYSASKGGSGKWSVAPKPVAPVYTGTMMDVLLPRRVATAEKARKVTP